MVSVISLLYLTLIFVTGLGSLCLTSPGAEDNSGTVPAGEGDADVPQAGEAVLESLTRVVRV